jgi:pyruvate formate lyase activating enzyme
MSNQEPSWQNTNHPARLEEILSEGTVRCHLSPRNCTLKEGVRGFCQVRMNRDGRLVTLNYGRGVHATEEKIETEAVYHYAPNERTYALGNIGCNLRCSYCQNWRTARVSNLSESEVYRYTPEGIIDTAQRHGIRCLSWTYNDPVVWHEFVLDTARLAKEAGLINLYKSAFYITIEAVDELLPLIDVFSVSIKTTNPEYYRKITGGHLQPVLEATKYIFEAGKHVEISNLMVTDSSQADRRLASRGAG